MKEVPSSVILMANNDIESSMKESSTKTPFYKRTRKTGYLRILLWNLSLEAGIFLKKPWDLESCAEFSGYWIPCTVPDVSGCILSHLSAASADILHCASCHVF